jgi:hypothetical protein
MLDKSLLEIVYEIFLYLSIYTNMKYVRYYWCYRPAFPKLVGHEPSCGGLRKAFEMWFFNYIKKKHKKWESEFFKCVILIM